MFRFCLVITMVAIGAAYPLPFLGMVGALYFIEHYFTEPEELEEKAACNAQE